MSRKKVSTTVYLDAEQVDKLKLLHQRTKVPVAEFIRQGVDIVLAQNKASIPGQQSLFDQPIKHPVLEPSLPFNPQVNAEALVSKVAGANGNPVPIKHREPLIVQVPTLLSRVNSQLLDEQRERDAQLTKETREGLIKQAAELQRRKEKRGT